jgi:tetrahydromethanopterin S-methyltransferase subunit B
MVAVAPGIAIYLHQSFVKITQEQMRMMMQESKADREVFVQAVDKLDRRIEMLEQVVRDMHK